MGAHDVFPEGFSGCYLLEAFGTGPDMPVLLKLMLEPGCLGSKCFQSAGEKGTDVRLDICDNMFVPVFLLVARFQRY